jgi:hypothetical protein
MIKLNWISSLDALQTSAARYTLALVPELRKYADVTVWFIPRSGSSVKNSELNPLQAKEYFPHHWHILNPADLTIYNLDPHTFDYYPMSEAGKYFPGLTILHNFDFGDLLDHSILHNRNRLYETVLKIGNLGTPSAIDFMKHFLAHEEEIRKNEKTGFALDCIENSLGVMSKADGLLQYLKQYYEIPVKTLSYPAQSVETHDDAQAIMEMVNLALSNRNRLNQKTMRHRISSELAKWIDSPTHSLPLISISEAISFVSDQPNQEAIRK